MKINTLVIDDDANWRTILAKFVNMMPSLQLTATCASAFEGYTILAEQEIDLIICDIEMPDMSGLNFIKSIRKPPMVIFVTSHRDYALDCYEVSPVDFLLKPLDAGRFMQSIEKAKAIFESSTEYPTVEPYFFIRENQNYVQILYNEVLYFKAQENFLKVVTKSQSYLPMVSISKMETQLKGDLFLRVHRSFIVNRTEISTISKDDILLKSGEKIPIGDQYRSKINRIHIENNLISRSN